MIRISDISKTTLPANVATIGFFDGVHRGHQYLISQLQQIGRQENLPTTVITFCEHPRRVMQQEYQPQLLSSLDEKCEQLARQQLDYAVTLSFTPALSQYTAYDFMRRILRDILHVKVLLIGHDHRFGHNREEGFADYVRYGQELGMRVVQTQACLLDEQCISSSLIRRLVMEGQMQQAAHYLGYPYHLAGTVVQGHRVGHRLGFPTANVQVSEPFKLIPARGVYAVWVDLDGCRYKGMLNIGNRPTLNNGTDCSIEVYIFDFDQQVYDHQIAVEFVARLRNECTFNSIEALKAQLQQDAHRVGLLFEELSSTL